MGLRRTTDGHALLGVMILCFLAGTVVLTYLAYSANNLYQTRRAIDHQHAVVMAQGGLDYAIVSLKRLVLAYQFSLTQAQLDAAIPKPADEGDYAFETPAGQDAFEISIQSAPTSGVLSNGHFLGMFGTCQQFRITVGVINTKSGEGAVFTQNMQAVGLYLIRFGVFYVPDLEILPGPTMRFYGPVHSNSDLFLGGPLSFYDRVTSHGEMYHRRKDCDERPGDAKIVDGADQLVPMYQHDGFVDSDDPEWMIKALELWDGNVLSGAHGVQELLLPIAPADNPHVIIERASATNEPGYNAQTEAEKYENRAGLKIYVSSNNVVTACDHDGNPVTGLEPAVLKPTGSDFWGRPLYEKDADGRYVMATNGAYTLTQNSEFQDWREGEPRQMASIDIYLDQLLSGAPSALLSNSWADGRQVLYVHRDAPDAAHLPCVRIRNGSSLPAGGLTIVSDTPVYVEGDYNTQSLDPGCTNPEPALVAGDAVTLLSKNWQDAYSVLNAKKRQEDHNITAADTRVNTVVMTGNTETTPGDYNGGLENVLRFQEYWSGRTLRFRGSIICMWNSQLADGPWEYGQYYTAPNRDWGYDEIYRTEVPPGMSRVFGLEEIEWDKSNWQREGWL